MIETVLLSTLLLSIPVRAADAPRSVQMINLSCMEALISVEQQSLAGVFSFIPEKDGPAAFADLVVHDKKKLKMYLAMVQKDRKIASGISAWDRESLLFALGLYNSPIGAKLDPGPKLKSQLQELAIAPVVSLADITAAPEKAMRALVTGAAGFVGSNLAIELARQGHQVVGLDDFSVGHFENLQDFNGDVVAADFADLNSWSKRVGKIDTIFHQAAITDTTVTDQLKMMRVNVEGFRDLLEWAAKTGVKKVVYASSAGVYGDGQVPMKETAARRPLNVYAFSKMVMENVAASFSKSHPKLELVGLRYFNVFGPRESFKGKYSSMIWQLSLQMKAGKRPRIFEHGEQFRDHIYVKDVVRANILASAKKVKGVYNVCTGKKTDFNEIIKFLNGAMGLNLAPDYFKNPYSFYQNETLGDPGAAVREFKFSAKYSVEEGIKDYFGGQISVRA